MTTTLYVIRQRQTSTLFSAVFLIVTQALLPAQADEAATNSPPDSLTASWSLRASLAERGVAPYATWTTEVLGNVSGGQRRTAWWTGLLDFGCELDTAKLGWWEGGQFLVQAHWVQSSRTSTSILDATGAFNPVSSLIASDHLRIFNLYYRHSWRDDTLVLKVGQLAADDDFMGSDYTGLFLNSAFGPLPSQVGTPLATSGGNPPAFPIYSVASPGLFFAVQPTERVYSQVGLYYGRPGFDVRDNYGFDWASQSPAELGLFWENGYRYKIAQRPATIRLGLTYHTGEVDDFRSLRTDDLPATTQNVPNFYAVHDLQLLADKEGNTRVGVFARGGFTPQQHLSMVALYADAGLNWFAPFPGRPDDVAGAAISYTRFGHDFRGSTDPDGIASDETTVELTYKAQVTHWMSLQGDLQFLLNPAINPRSGSRETAVVLGLRAEVNF